MTRVLVVYATKMGGTRDIAVEIGRQLTQGGSVVKVADAHDLTSLGGYDGVVIGSALYIGRWRPEAVALLAEQATHGRTVPVWLYQSGPCGADVDLAQAAPKRVAEYAQALGAAPPTTFGGRLEPATAVGFVARRMSKGARAGDFRDFAAVRRYADRISAALTVAGADPTLTSNPLPNSGERTRGREGRETQPPAPIEIR